MSGPTVTHEVDTITVCPGQTLTVWLRQGSRSQQFELRVRLDGLFEVYTRDAGCVTSFDDWYPMPDRKTLEEQSDG